jgi:pyridoxine 5-phosphate synthase
MTKFSININKFALIRNARDQDTPNLLQLAQKCIDYGCHGLTVHPRPDERHIRYSDLKPLKTVISTYPKIEFNIEGYPSTDFIKKIIDVKPHQVTLVPDPPEALTSSFGWNLNQHKKQLTQLVTQFKKESIRCSLFIDPTTYQLDALHTINPDRVELYTYDYNHRYLKNRDTAIEPYQETVNWITTNTTIGINAGHDLNLNNLSYLLTKLPEIKEVSIGHQFVCDCLEFGLEKTIHYYLNQLPKSTP